MNGILIVLCIYFVVNGGLYLYAPNIYFPNQDALMIGEGTTILFMLFFVFMVASFIAGVALFVNGAIVIKREGKKPAHFLPLFFGGMGIIWPIIYWASSLGLNENAFLPFFYQAVFSVFTYIPFMLASFFLYSFIYAALPKNKHCNYIIVLGARIRSDGSVTPLLAQRLNKAIAVFQAGEKKSNLCSFGRARQG